MEARALIRSQRTVADPTPEPSRLAFPTAVPRKRLDWTYFITLGSEAGRHWIEEYRQAGGMELTGWTEEALELLRRRRLAEGLTLLDRAGRFAASLEASPAAGAATHLMRRWHQAALAYYHYCVEDFAQAIESLEQADGAIRQAIEAEPWLAPLATHCHEFRLQHARIARGRRRWPEMWGHLETARAMLEQRQPLCVLSDGTAVDYAALARFYGPLSGYQGDDRKSLIAILEMKYRLRYFERHLHHVYTPAGFIIPYP
jgi:tetratricopeptide (TPR) repeat protein